MQQALLRSLSPDFFMFSKAAIRFAQGFPFPTLNNPHSLGLSSYDKCSSPLIIFVALLCRSQASRGEGEKSLPNPCRSAVSEETSCITSFISQHLILAFPVLCSVLYHTAYCVELPSEDRTVKQSTVTCTERFYSFMKIRN